MTSKPDLLVAPCSYQAAKYAVMRWHYSRVVPSTYTRLVKFGVWDNGKFCGSIIFSHGSNRNIGTPYGLTITECVELVRVALAPHSFFSGHVVSIAVKMLRCENSGLRLIVSYADTAQRHIGTLYQALNWIYVGEAGGGAQYMIGGKPVHKKAVWASYGTNKIDSIPGASIIAASQKHKYLYPLDRAMRRQIAPLAQPYPKRNDVRPVNGDTLTTSEAGRFNPDPDA